MNDRNKKQIKLRKTETKKRRTVLTVSSKQMQVMKFARDPSFFLQTKHWIKCGPPQNNKILPQK